VSTEGCRSSSQNGVKSKKLRNHCIFLDFHPFWNACSGIHASQFSGERISAKKGNYLKSHQNLIKTRIGSAVGITIAIDRERTKPTPRLKLIKLSAREGHEKEVHDGKQKEG
jgi:hypothetical protein